MNDMNSLTHTTWNCQYHIVLPPAPSITQGPISTHKVKFSSACVLNTKAAPLVRPLENIFAITGLSGVSPQKSLQEGPLLSLQP